MTSLSVLQFRWISHDFVEIRKLKMAYIAKGIFAGILIILAIAFAILLYTANDAGGAPIFQSGLP